MSDSTEATSSNGESDVDAAPISRDDLLREHMPLVKQVALKIASRLPPNVELDDLIGSGMIGLLDAVDKFDRAKSVNFRKYAEIRIKGAILDELRAMDHVSRTIRRQTTQLSQAVQKIQEELGRKVTDEEVAEHLGVDMQGYHALLNKLKPVLVLGFDDLTGDQSRDPMAMIPDKTMKDPQSLLHQKRLRELIQDELERLKERQRLVVRFYYYDPHDAQGDRQGPRRQREPHQPDAHPGDRDPRAPDPQAPARGGAEDAPDGLAAAARGRGRHSARGSARRTRRPGGRVKGRRLESLGIAIAALAAVALASSAGAARVPEPDVLDADDPLVIDDVRGDLDITGSGPSDEDLVLAAQKLRTTVQEAPSIIYVVTRRQIEERGYRTVNEVLRTVPGFEGDRWEGNGWQRENFARGLPNTVLVLVNGVNIVEPLRNMAALDRKIPLEIVERIEVTSGPGGVLWGSNALLGVVNIVTRRIDDTGLQALVGAGDGPGDRVAVKGALGYSARLSEDVGLWLHANFYSSEGPELLLDSQKVLGSLPEPADDTPTLYLPESLELSSGERDWHLTLAGRLELGTVSLDWLIPFERDHRAIATGGAPLTVDYLDPARGGRASSASDVVRVVQLTWADRFANDDVGVKVRAFGVQWDVDEDPFGVYPASPAILAGRGHTKDLHLSLVGELQVRAGLAADVDVRVTDALRILAGGEAYVDVNEGLNQTAWVIDELGTCPEGFVYDPDDPYLPCRFNRAPGAGRLAPRRRRLRVARLARRRPARAQRRPARPGVEPVRPGAALQRRPRLEPGRHPAHQGLRLDRTAPAAVRRDPRPRHRLVHLLQGEPGPRRRDVSLLRARDQRRPAARRGRDPRPSTCAPTAPSPRWTTSSSARPASTPTPASSRS